MKSPYVVVDRHTKRLERDLPRWSDDLPDVAKAAIGVTSHWRQHLPDARIVRFSQEQAATFMTYDQDALRRAAYDARPPFARTFYDFGFLRVGHVEVVGALVLDAEHARDFNPDQTWTALVMTRDMRTNEYTQALHFNNLTASSKKIIDFTEDGMLVRHAVHEQEIDVVAAVVDGALTFLTSANVDVVEVDSPSRPHLAHDIPHYEVLVRQASRRLVYADAPDNPQDWTHRWEVRGHFKHFRTGAIFEKHVDRAVKTDDGDCFVRIWCPSHVKGPDDKPFVPKIRRVA